MAIKFRATGVYEDTYNAIKERITDDYGRSQVKWKIIIQEGSSRSSKTWSDLQAIFMYACENRLKSVIVLRDVAVDCHDIIEKDFITWMSDPMMRMREYEDGLITIDEAINLIEQEDLTKFFIRNRQKHTWTHKETKSVIKFTGLDDENKAMGFTNDLCWINEPYAFNEEVFRQLLQRNKQIIFDWNPKTQHFINTYKKKENTIVLHSTYKDNPFCPPESLEQLESYQPIKHAKVVKGGKIKEREAKEYDIENNPLEFTKKELKELTRCIVNEKNGTASEFHYLVYCLGIGAERPNRIYSNWIELSQEEFDNLKMPNYYGLDFGVNAPTALVEVKYDSKNHSFYIYLRLYKPMNKMISPDGHGIIRELEALKIPKNIPIIVDPADLDNRTLLVRNGYNIISAYKPNGSVSSGISLVQQSKIYYVHSKELFNEYDNYCWEVVKSVSLDRPLKKDDHALDALRYCITWLYAYLGLK